MQKMSIGMLLAIAMLTAGDALGQTGGIQDYKIGPPNFHESDVVTIPIGPVHIPPDAPPPSIAGWAGVLVGVHNLDNTEVDVDAVFTAGNPGFPMLPNLVTDPLGPRSNNLESSFRYVKLLHPQHQQSGITVNPSQYLPGPPGAAPPLGGVEVHVKGTSVGENSDTDLVINVYNIWHIRQDSVAWELQNSDLVWGPEDLPPFHRPDSLFEIPPAPPLEASVGNWWHVQGPVPGFVPFHFFASQFYATLADTITVGIEHVPEPTSLVLLGLGLSCAGMGVRSRMRRS